MAIEKKLSMPKWVNIILAITVTEILTVLLVNPFYSETLYCSALDPNEFWAAMFLFPTLFIEIASLALTLILKHTYPLLWQRYILSMGIMAGSLFINIPVVYVYRIIRDLKINERDPLEMLFLYCAITAAIVLAYGSFICFADHYIATYIRKKSCRGWYYVGIMCLIIILFPLFALTLDVVY